MVYTDAFNRVCLLKRTSRKRIPSSLIHTKERRVQPRSSKRYATAWHQSNVNNFYLKSYKNLIQLCTPIY